MLKADKDTQDIKTVVSFNDVLYMYSTDIMSERYAKALADGNETEEGGALQTAGCKVTNESMQER